MVAQHMVRGTHTQTTDPPTKETPQHNKIRARGGRVARRDEQVQVRAGQREGQRAEEVRPDVDGFVVQVQERVQRGEERVGRGAVACVDGRVVAPPGRQVVPVDDAGEGGFDGLSGGCGGLAGLFGGGVGGGGEGCGGGC